MYRGSAMMTSDLAGVGGVPLLNIRNVLYRRLAGSLLWEIWRVVHFQHNHVVLVDIHRHRIFRFHRLVANSMMLVNYSLCWFLKLDILGSGKGHCRTLGEGHAISDVENHEILPDVDEKVSDLSVLLYC